MSDWTEIKKQHEELKQKQLSEKREQPAGQTGGGQGADLNLLNVHGTDNKQTKANSDKAPPAAKPDEKKEEDSGLWAITKGLARGGWNTLKSLPTDVYHMATREGGLQASLFQATKDTASGVQYLSTNGDTVINRAVQSWNSASNGKRAEMIGSAGTLGLTLFWGGGGLFKSGRIAEETAGLRALSRAAELGKEGRFATELNALGREARVARILEETEGAGRVLPRASRDLASLGKRTEFLNGVRVERTATEAVQVTHAIEAERLMTSPAAKLSEELKALRTTAGPGGAVEMAVGRQALIEKEESAVVQAARALEKPGSAASETVARREFSDALTRWKKAVGIETSATDAGAIRDMDRVLAEFDRALVAGRETRVTAGGAEMLAPERLTAQLQTQQEVFTRQLSEVQKGLSTSTKAEDVLALQRSRELETSMTSVVKATDAAAREKAVAEFDTTYKAYIEAVKDSSLGKAGKVDMVLADRTALEFRSAASGVMDFRPVAADGRLMYGSNLAEAQLMATREREVAAQLQKARELTTGSTTAEAQAIRREASSLEEGMRNLRNAERAVAESAGRERVAAEALAARDRAVAEFEARVKSWDTLVNDSKLVKSAGADLTLAERTAVEVRNVSGVAREMGAVTEAGTAARMESATQLGRGTVAADLNTAGKVDGVLVSGRGALTSDVTAGVAERQLAMRTSTATARLEEATALGDVAVNARVGKVQEALRGYEAALSGSGTKLEEASASLRSSIRAYNEALDASPAAKGLASRLYLDESIASPVRVGADRLANTTPTIYGDGSALFLQRNLSTGAPVNALGEGPLSTRVQGLAAAAGETGYLRSAQERLSAVVSQAVDSVFRTGGMVRGLIPEPVARLGSSTMQYLGTGWGYLSPVAKGYVLANGIWIMAADSPTYLSVFNSGKILPAGASELPTTFAAKAQLSAFPADMQALPGGRAAGSTAGDTTGGATGRGTATGAQEMQRTGAQPAQPGQPGGPGTDAQRRDAATGSQEKSSFGQVMASPQGPALSPVVQALALPKTDSQAIPRGVIAEELKKKPSWWSAVYGDVSGHRPLLKADDSKPADEAKVAPFVQGPRRIGGIESDPQKLVTPTFNPSIIRLQSELLGTGSNRRADARVGLYGTERKGRVRGGGSLQDEEKLVKQFPFLLSSTTGSESGAPASSGARFAAKAEDQEHKSMGRITGGSAPQTAQSGGQDDESSQALVAQSGLQSPSGSGQNEENI